MDLALPDVHLDFPTGFISLRIKASKTDPFREGITLRIASTGNHLCPFSALCAYLHCRRYMGPGPLFILQDGQFLTRGHLSRLLTRVFPGAPPGTLATHSFRIGGATRLCALGVPDATIQLLGRWSSSAFKQYLRVSDGLLARLHGGMSCDSSSR